MGHGGHGQTLTQPPCIYRFTAVPQNEGPPSTNALKNGQFSRTPMNSIGNDETHPVFMFSVFFVLI